MKGIALQEVFLQENLFVAIYNSLRILLKEVSGSLVKIKEAFYRVLAMVFRAWKLPFDDIKGLQFWINQSCGELAWKVFF